METQPTVPSMARKARPWAQEARQAIMVDEFDRGVLEHAFTIYNLATESAREALLPTPAHRITIVMKELSVELRALVSAGRVAAARDLLAESAGAQALRWAEVLALPKATSQPKTGRSDFSRNADWLREHREAYTGNWVALLDGQLVDYDKSRLALHRRLEAAGKLTKGTLFTKVA